MYDNYEWLHSLYTLDGKTIYALIHTEYQGWNRNNCQSSNLADGWWNSINLATSTNGRASYSHLCLLINFKTVQVQTHLVHSISNEKTV